LQALIARQRHPIKMDEQHIVLACSIVLYDTKTHRTRQFFASFTDCLVCLCDACLCFIFPFYLDLAWTHRHFSDPASIIAGTLKIKVQSKLRMTTRSLGSAVPRELIFVMTSTRMSGFLLNCRWRSSFLVLLCRIAISQTLNVLLRAFRLA